MLFVGRLETKKNIDGVIRAYLEYRQQTAEPLDIVLAGKPGFGWDATLRTIPPGLVGQSVHLVGWIDDNVKSIIESSATMMVFVSRYEGFGIPPRESMRHGVPVIASPAGAIPEILRDAAVYVDPEDHRALSKKMSELVANASLRQELAQKGIELVKEYTWGSTAKNYGRGVSLRGRLEIREQKW